MRMSLTSTCGWLCCMACNTSLAVENALYGISSRASAFSSTQRIERSSSTIQTGFIKVLCSELRSGRQGQQDGETSPSWNTFAIDGAVVLGDEGLRDGQAQARSPFASGNQREKNPLSNLIRCARAIVFDGQRQCQTLALLR